MQNGLAQGKEKQAEHGTSFKIRPIQVALTHSSESSKGYMSEDVVRSRLTSDLADLGISSVATVMNTTDGHRVLPGEWSLELSLAVRFERLAPGSHTHPSQPHASLAVLWIDGILRLTLPGETTASARRYSERYEFALQPDTSDPDSVYKPMFIKASNRCAQWVKREVENFSRPAENLVKLLESYPLRADSSILERLAQLRVVAAVPALVHQLNQSQSSDLRLRIIGVLAEIGDESAADGLMRAANPRDREEFSAILVAVSTIGGQRVADFLEIFAQHDSLGVRAMVEEAQERLRRRHGQLNRDQARAE